MAVISSRFNISVPSTDILTYIFDSPWDSTQGYPDDEPIILSARGVDQPSCTFNELKHLVKCFACGFKTLAPSNPRVVLYGTLNVYLPAVLLGALGAGASCNICPAYPLAETTARLRTIKADYVFFQPEHLETVTTAAKIAGVPDENLFILDESETCEKLQSPVSHWASLLDLINGPSFQWKRLSDDESKKTTALFCHTSGYFAQDSYSKDEWPNSDNRQDYRFPENGRENPLWLDWEYGAVVIPLPS
jgi:4-coumarate--CoA ligase